MKNVAVLVFFLSSVCLADEPEKYFEQAKKYTVKIKSSVLIPFDHDSSKGTGMGSGFVVDRKRGWAVTNAHVVSHSPAQVEVSSFDQTSVPTEVLYIDPYLDVAFIKVPTEQIQGSAVLDCDEYQSIGVTVGAFGHPWGLPYTGTKGIISGHSADLSSIKGEFLQTDAPINPGNSGGPLINLKNGKVVGMNTAGRNQAQNTNFAIPADQICHLMSFLQKGQDPSPPRLPFSFFRNDDDIGTLKIAQKHSESEINVMEGDVVTSAFSISEGKFVVVKNEPQLVNALRGQAKNAKFKVMRNKKELLIEGNLQPYPKVMAHRGVFFSGMLLHQQNDPDISQVMGKSEFVQLGYVEEGSAAERGGLRMGDVIESINGEKVTKIEDCHAKISEVAGPNQAIAIKVKRLDMKNGHFFSYYEKQLPRSAVQWLSFKQDQATAVRLPASGEKVRQ